MLYLADADTAPKKMEEGGDSKLHKDLRRRGWMRYAVVAAALEGRMSRRDVVVEVAAQAEAPVSGRAAADFAFAPSRRLS